MMCHQDCHTDGRRAKERSEPMSLYLYGLYNDDFPALPSRSFKHSQHARRDFSLKHRPTSEKHSHPASERPVIMHGDLWLPEFQEIIFVLPIEISFQMSQSRIQKVLRSLAFKRSPHCYWMLTKDIQSIFDRVPHLMWIQSKFGKRSGNFVWKF